VASGKTALGDGLHNQYGFHKVKTRDLIVKLKPRVAHTRLSLQRAGDTLDRSTEGAWVVDGLARELLALTDPDVDVVIDAVRKREQLHALREAYGRAVFHVHVTANIEELGRRYSERDGKVQELPSYEEVRRNATERKIETLADVADVVVDSARCDKADVLVRVTSALGLYGVSRERLVDVLVGGQWGSEGKGHIAWYLAPEYDLLVRTGGPNAGHTVVERARGKYTFHLLPSGTMASDAKLLIGPGATVQVDQLLREIADCDVSQDRLAIDPQVMVITNEDKAAESGLVAGIGSTGQGGGAAAARRIMERHAAPHVRLAKDYAELQPYIKETAVLLETAYARGQRVLVEGTQGTGLSIYHGSYPHVTSRDTTASGTCAEAGIPPHRVNHVIMVCRTYPIRVQNPEDGTSGPMGIEISWSTVAERSGLDAEELQTAEKTSTTKKDRRVAEFGWADLRRASTLNGPTDIALTFADYLSAKNRKARRFEQLDDATIKFIEEVERVAAAPASLITTRFHERSIIDRRSWGRR